MYTSKTEERQRAYLNGQHSPRCHGSNGDCPLFEYGLLRKESQKAPNFQAYILHEDVHVMHIMHT